MLNVNSSNIDIYKTDTEYMTMMTLNPNVYIDINRLLVMLHRDDANLQGIEKIIKRYVLTSRDVPLGDIKKSTLVPFLIECEGVPSEMFDDPSTKSDCFSFSAEVRQNIVNNKYALMFMELVNHYLENNSYFTKALPCKVYVRDIGMKTNFGTPLGIIPFRYRKSVTSRIYTSDYSFQGLPNKYKQIIAAPKDYFLLWADFSQIDLRVMYNMFYNNDVELRDFVKQCGDYYQAVAMTAAKHANQDFNSNLFAEERSKYKQKILSIFYGASYNTLRDLNYDLAQNLYKYITTNSQYIAYKQAIRDNVKSNLGFSVRTYFGREIIKYPQSKDVERACLNAPIQATSADIMQIFAVKLLAEFRYVAEEILKQPCQNLIKIMLNRHDEAIFCIHKSLIPYANIFREYSKIQIDDWAPLELHWSAGYNYDEPDEELISELNKSTYPVRFNGEPIHYRPCRYNPIRSIIYGSLTKYTDNNTVIYCISIYPLDKLYVIRLSENQDTKDIFLSNFKMALYKNWSFDEDGLFKVILDTDNVENQFVFSQENVEFVCTYKSASTSLTIGNIRMNTVERCLKENLDISEELSEEVVILG